MPTTTEAPPAPSACPRERAPGYAADFVEHLARVQQCLGRHARVQGAFAADEAFLHDRRREAVGCGAASENFAGRACADNDDVELRHDRCAVHQALLWLERWLSAPAARAEARAAGSQLSGSLAPLAR
jgi:hypothetical protein